MNQILVTGGAGFIGANLVLELQRRFPGASITVVDDFRSGNFKNLRGFRGDFVARDVSTLDWWEQFGECGFDGIFHEASITDTTVHDQKLQAHDNIEGFRRLLEFAAPSRTPVVYASSAATYGIASTIMKEDDPPAPANIYAFSKVQLDNLARMYRSKDEGWKIAGLRYFNVYGPGEVHKDKAASMIYQLYVQMKQGNRPKVFEHGEQKRDFVYVKDVVGMTIQAMESEKSGIFNCGSGHAFSFNEVIESLNQCLGTNLEPDYIVNPYEFYQPHTEADMSLAASELGWTPAYAPARGIEEYVSILES